jgi:hypothetical protein
MAVDAKGFGDGVSCLACRDSVSDLLPQLVWNAWAPNALALCPGASHPGSGALGYLLRLDLGQ